MNNWGRRDYIPVVVVIILVVFISYMSRQVEVTVEEPPVELGKVRIAVLDAYNSRYFPETKEYYEFISDMAERDVKQYLNETGVKLDYDVIFYPIEGIFETLEKVMQCKKEGIDLIVGMPNGLALDQSVSYMLCNDMLFMCIGATQANNFNWNDTCFRLLPKDTHRAGPLAETMYERSIRKVVVVTDSYFLIVDAFQEKFCELGGEIVDSYEYRPHYGEIVNNTVPVKSVDIDLDQISDSLRNITRVHPSDEVAIFHLGGGLPEVLNMTQDYPELLNVTWFSYWDTVHRKDKLESMGSMISDIKLVSLVEGLAESEYSQRINQEFNEEFGRDMTVIEANIYDGVWILSLSILEEASTAPMDLKDRIPLVASEYFGLTGRCELDEVGDRLSFNYTIWGYAYIKGETKYSQFGFYDYDKEQVSWIE